MNRRSSRHLRYILVPLLAALIFIAAISISDSYNSSSFPKISGMETVRIAADPVTVTDAASYVPAAPYAPDMPSASDETSAPDGTRVSDESRVSEEPDISPGSPAVTDAPGGSDEARVQVVEDPEPAATEKTTEKKTAKTAADPGSRENAPYVADPDYGNKYYIVVFTGSQNVIIYGKGEDGGFNDPVKCFVCSSGRKGHSTRTGCYSIIRRYRWRLLVGDVYGQYATGFSPSYLFHSVPYLKENDPSSLDMAEYDMLGQPASKGCIRLCVRDAKWIFENCPDGTQINIVSASSDMKGERIIPRDDRAYYAGWDPSDPDPASPYND